MWGWKSVEGIIHQSKSLDEARLVVKEYGFSEFAVNESHIVFRKTGKWIYFNGKHAGIELHLSTHKDGLFMLMRYNDFIPFDTGDLTHFADEIAQKIGNAAAHSQMIKVPHYSTISF